MFTQTEHPPRKFKKKISSILSLSLSSLRELNYVAAIAFSNIIILIININFAFELDHL